MTTTERIYPISIELQRAEGAHADCYAVTLRRIWDSDRRADLWAASDHILQQWATTAPASGYDKCDFTVTYVNGRTRSGRLDLTRQDATQVDILGQQLRRESFFYAGRWCPPGIDAADYQAFLARPRTRLADDWDGWCDHYELGKETSWP